MTIGGTKVPSRAFADVNKLEHSLKKLGIGNKSLDAVSYSSWLINRHNPIGPISRFFKHKDSASRLHHTVMRTSPEHSLKVMIDTEHIPQEGSADLSHITEYLLMNPSKGSLDYRKKIGWVWVNSNEEIIVEKEIKKYEPKSGHPTKKWWPGERLKTLKRDTEEGNTEEMLKGIQSSIGMIAIEMKREGALKEYHGTLETIEDLCRQGQGVEKSTIPGFQEKLRCIYLQDCLELLEGISEFKAAKALLDCFDTCDGKTQLKRLKR